MVQAPAPSMNRLGTVALWSARVLWRRTELSRGAYVAVASAVSLAISALAALLYWFVTVGLLGLELPTAAPKRETPLAVDLVGMVAFAPLAETFVLAMLVGLARGWTNREAPQVLAGALPLGLLHGFLGVTLVDTWGHALVSVPGFLVFAFVYVAWRRHSYRRAFWMCAAVHAVHNAVVFVAMLAGGGFGV